MPTIETLFASSQARLIRHLAAVAVFLNGEAKEISLGLVLYHMPVETYARRAVFAAVRRLATGREAYVVARMNDQAVIYTLKNEIYAKTKWPS